MTLQKPNQTKKLKPGYTGIQNESKAREQRVTLPKKSCVGFQPQPESLREPPLFIAFCLQRKDAIKYCQQKPNLPGMMKGLVDGAHLLSKDLLPKDRELKVVADFHKKLGARGTGCMRLAQHPILRSQALTFVTDKEKKNNGGTPPLPLNC